MLKINKKLINNTKKYMHQLAKQIKGKRILVNKHSSKNPLFLSLLQHAHAQIHVFKKALIYQCMCKRPKTQIKVTCLEKSFFNLQVT